jgi:hypothetical protein
MIDSVGKRSDIVEDYLKIIIKSKSPLLHKIINKSFLKLLKLTCPSFEEYIKNIYLQTE